MPARLQPLLSAAASFAWARCPFIQSCSPVKDPTIHFTTSSKKFFLRTSLTVPLLPRRNRSFRPRFLMPFLHSCPFPCLLSTVGSSRLPILRCSVPARQVISLRAVAISFRDLPSPWVRSFSFRRLPMARRLSPDRSSVVQSPLGPPLC